MIFMVTAVGNGHNPSFIVQIPFNGFAHTIFKVYLRIPAQLLANFCSIDNISAIMAGAIFDIGNQRASVFAVGKQADRIFSCIVGLW
jgi:hypothetical protein